VKGATTAQVRNEVVIESRFTVNSTVRPVFNEKKNCIDSIIFTAEEFIR